MFVVLYVNGAPYGIRTRVTAVKGRHPLLVDVRLCALVTLILLYIMNYTSPIVRGQPP